MTATTQSAASVPATVTPSEQKFASDATAQIPTVRHAVESGALTASELASYGQSICNLMPDYLDNLGPGSAAFNQIATEFSDGATKFRITGDDDRSFVSLAIDDICPTYADDIPGPTSG